jgi:hypothetical protein
MPTASDAPGLWAITVLGAAGVAAMIHFGRGPWTIYGTVRRSENPVAFWVSVGIFAIADFVLAFMALLASVPWPPRH